MTWFDQWAARHQQTQSFQLPVREDGEADISPLQIQHIRAASLAIDQSAVAGLGAKQANSLLEQIRASKDALNRQAAADPDFHNFLKEYIRARWEPGTDRLTGKKIREACEALTQMDPLWINGDEPCGRFANVLYSLYPGTLGNVIQQRQPKQNQSGAAYLVIAIIIAIALWLVFAGGGGSSNGSRPSHSHKSK